MLFLDDFLEMLEELPGELRERCKEIKDLDAEITASHSAASVAIKEYFAHCEGMREEERRERLKELQATYARLRSRSEEKVALTERMQELLEKYTQHLEKEKMHLKFELEADNAGVTEVIEKRFAEYVEQMFSQRKERRKRPAPSTSSGAGGNLIEEGHETSTSRSVSVSLPPSSKSVRVEGEGGPLSALLPPAPRARKNSLPLTKEESALKEARRDAIRLQLQASLHLKTSMANGGGGGGASTVEKDGYSTPIARSRPSPSTPTTSANHFVFSPSSTSSSPLNPLLSPALSSMPNFVSTESRHGRPRKLTSRVQEMFNSNQSLTGHRERSRHSSTAVPPTPPLSSHAVAAALSSTPTGTVTPPEEEETTPTQPPRSGGEGDEEGNDERPWCFCNEKSYGGMVACDGKECPYEWFHWPCVGLEAAPRGKWFCPHCAEIMAEQ